MKKIKIDLQNLKIYLFAGTIALFFIIGCLFMLRPKTSVVEKRNLTEYPEFTFESFWNGEYFSQVSTWYSDTYPIRETLISGNKKVQEFYGIRDEQLVGGAPQVADDIPEITLIDSLMGKIERKAEAIREAKERKEQEDNKEDVKPDEKSDETPDEDKPSDDGKVEEDLPDGTITEKGETSGSIYVTNDAGYEMVYFNQSGADHFIKTVNDIYDRVKEEVNLYVMVVPTAAAAMLDQSVIEDMNASDQQKIIQYLYDGIDGNIGEIPVLEELRHHNAEYIYFRTDHHWTQLGAYYAYVCFCREKGIEPKPLNEYETIEIDGFTGTFCQQAPKLEKNPDTVIGYIPNGTNSMKMIEHSGDATIDWWVVNDVSSYDPTDYYAAFAGGDTAWACAHNDTITDGSAIMVIKDSFANAFIPWLVDQYEYVYWVDVRYADKTITEMVEEYGIDDVLIMFSIFNATTDSKLDELAQIGE